ncbi:homologous-pairing protein 2 homolog [Juglans regia]|uniref:Homologous-pairing protein 2 homolog n=2 Tax=Juglans regia TaxID=51240 RepID=A0A6P9EPA7_JUGRE|nr:homologous-pairing protein 2 homolog [Juglans regia]
MPLNSQNVADYLQKFNLKKVVVQKALDTLADTGEISFSRSTVSRRFTSPDKTNLTSRTTKSLIGWRKKNASLQQHLQEQRKAVGEVEGGKTRFNLGKSVNLCNAMKTVGDSSALLRPRLLPLLILVLYHVHECIVSLM